MSQSSYQFLAKVKLYSLLHSECFLYVEVFISCQALFVVMMVLMFTLLVNMLIAMMGNTYQTVADTRKEWTRQVKLLDALKLLDP